MKRGNLLGEGIDGVKCHSVPTRKVVHGCKRDVEAVRDGVDGDDVDPVAVVLQPPTRSTFGRAPTADGEDTADAGECGQVTECIESCGDQAVGAVGARNVVQRSCWVVVKLVVADDVCRCDGKECCKREDGGSELHCEDVIRRNEKDMRLTDGWVVRMHPSFFELLNVEGLYVRYENPV